MPRNAKNPANPHAAAVDALSEFNLQVILEYMEHRGGPARIASLSIGKIPGLLPVIYYIDHERSIGNRAADVFDFFHVGRTTVQPEITDDTQELIYVLDDSEDNSGAGQLQPQPGEENTAAEPPPLPTNSAWSLPVALIGYGMWIGPQQLASLLLGSDANPFTM